MRARGANRCGRLQPEIAAGQSRALGHCRGGGRGSSRRLHAHESRHGAEDDFEYALYRSDDSSRLCLRQPDGQRSPEEREVGGARRGHSGKGRRAQPPSSAQTACGCRRSRSCGSFDGQSWRATRSGCGCAQQIPRASAPSYGAGETPPSRWRWRKGLPTGDTEVPREHAARSLRRTSCRRRPAVKMKADFDLR
jgi:hypothetical protein